MAKEKEEAKPVEAKEKAYKRTEVVTQTSPAILDTKENRAMDMNDVLVEVLNKLDKIEKAVA